MRSAQYGGMTTPTRILVPTDFSAPADAALTYALALAEKLGATVSLVHVFDDPRIANLYSEQFVAMPDELRSQILASIGRQLADRVTKRGHTEMTPVIVTGSVAQSIIDAVADQGADLIVMGTHGRHGVAHLLLGSVAERVVRTAACPVLTVRAPMETARHAVADTAGCLAPVHA